MDDNEKTPPQSSESDKRLKLDLSEALNQGADDDDDIIELKDEVTLPTTAKEEDIVLRDQLNDDMQGDELTPEKIIDIDTPDDLAFLLGLRTDLGVAPFKRLLPGLSLGTFIDALLFQADAVVRLVLGTDTHVPYDPSLVGRTGPIDPIGPVGFGNPLIQRAPVSAATHEAGPEAAKTGPFRV